MISILSRLWLSSQLMASSARGISEFQPGINSNYVTSPAPVKRCVPQIFFVHCITEIALFLFDGQHESHHNVVLKESVLWPAKQHAIFAIPCQISNQTHQFLPLKCGRWATTL